MGVLETGSLLNSKQNGSTGTGSKPVLCLNLRAEREYRKFVEFEQNGNRKPALNEFFIEFENGNRF